MRRSSKRRKRDREKRAREQERIVSGAAVLSGESKVDASAEVANAYSVAVDLTERERIEKEEE